MLPDWEMFVKSVQTTRMSVVCMAYNCLTITLPTNNALWHKWCEPQKKLFVARTRWRCKFITQSQDFAAKPCVKTLELDAKSTHRRFILGKKQHLKQIIAYSVAMEGMKCSSSFSFWSQFNFSGMMDHCIIHAHVSILAYSLIEKPVFNCWKWLIWLFGNKLFSSVKDIIYE